MKMNVFKREFEVPVAHKVLIRSLVWGIPVLLAMGTIWYVNRDHVIKFPEQVAQLDDLELDFTLISHYASNADRKEFFSNEENVAVHIDDIRRSIVELYHGFGFTDYTGPDYRSYSSDTNVVE